MNKPSAILMGSKPGSVVALRMLIESGWDVRAVVTTNREYQPWSESPSLIAVASEERLPHFIQSELPRTQRADFVISYMYRNLVNSDVLALADRAAVNFHAAPLPELGGFGCYNRAVLYDLAEFGATCHYMDGQFDTGDILLANRYPINAKQETALSVERKAQEEMIRLFGDFLQLGESGDPLPRVVQNREMSEYWTEDELVRNKAIPPNADEETVDRYARAFWYPPYEGASLQSGDMRIEVIPSIARIELGGMTHRDAYSRLSAVARKRLAMRPEPEETLATLRAS